MLKSALIATMLAALVWGQASAQQREAVLQKVDVPAAGFDIVVALAKPGSPAVDLRAQPDPTVLYLMGGELVTAYTGETQKVFPDIGALTVPACAFHAESQTGGKRTPVAIYLVPKKDTTN